MKNRIELDEKISGFTERDLHSKAILNTDSVGLLRYKINRQKNIKINKGHRVADEMFALKNEMNEIKKLLLQITNIK